MAIMNKNVHVLKFEDTKGVIGSSNSKKGRQYNGQKNKGPKNDMQNT